MFSQALYIATLLSLLPCIFSNRYSRPNPNFVLIEDRAHLQQHLYNKTDIDNMSAEDARYVYFINHDSDLDDKLDGLEILQAILHHQEKSGPLSKLVFSDEDFAMIVDPILESCDKNDDGFLDFSEFKNYKSLDDNDDDEDYDD